MILCHRRVSIFTGLEYGQEAGRRVSYGCRERRTGRPSQRALPSEQLSNVVRCSDGDVAALTVTKVLRATSPYPSFSRKRNSYAPGSVGALRVRVPEAAPFPVWTKRQRYRVINVAPGQCRDPTVWVGHDDVHLSGGVSGGDD